MPPLWALALLFCACLRLLAVTGVGALSPFGVVFCSKVSSPSAKRQWDQWWGLLQRRLLLGSAFFPLSGSFLEGRWTPNMHLLATASVGINPVGDSIRGKPRAGSRCFGAAASPVPHALVCLVLTLFPMQSPSYPHTQTERMCISPVGWAWLRCVWC